MLKVSFFVKPGGKLVGFQIKGHAHAAPYGQDIVCAAVSSAAFMAVNTLTEVKKICVEVESHSGLMQCDVCEKDLDVARDILQGLKVHLQELEVQYSGYLVVNYVDV